VEIVSGLGTYSFFAAQSARKGVYGIEQEQQRSGNSESVWRQVFFPFSNPLALVTGETVTLRLACGRSSRTRDMVDVAGISRIRLGVRQLV